MQGKELDHGAGGRMSLPELAERLDFVFSDEEHEDEDTIGGHVTARLGRLPQNGDAVRVCLYVAKVIDSSRQRVQRLQLLPVDPEPSQESH